LALILLRRLLSIELELIVLIVGVLDFIASGVLRAMVSNKTPDSYRIPFAIQWIWPPLLIVGVYLAPESPWQVSCNGD